MISLIVCGVMRRARARPALDTPRIRATSNMIPIWGSVRSCSSSALGHARPHLDWVERLDVRVARLHRRPSLGVVVVNGQPISGWKKGEPEESVLYERQAIALLLEATCLLDPDEPALTTVRLLATAGLGRLYALKHSRSRSSSPRSRSTTTSARARRTSATARAPGNGSLT